MKLYTPLRKFIPNMVYHIFDYSTIENKQENEMLQKYWAFYWNFFSVYKVENIYKT